MLQARQETLELELDGAGHKVLLSDAGDGSFRPLPEALKPTPALPQARTAYPAASSATSWLSKREHALGTCQLLLCHTTVLL